MALRVSSPILVGRSDDLAGLLGALHDAAQGHSRVALVGGEAGIGKTRLLSAFAEAARGAGALVLVGGSVRMGHDEGLPYAPVVEALRGLVRDRGSSGLERFLDGSTAQLATLLPELAGQGIAAPAADQRPDWAVTRMFDAVRTLLARLGGEVPVVFAVEDLHWSDHSTRSMLAFLARTLRGQRVLLVGTYRTDELHRRHPLLPWIAELDRLGATRIALTGLARDEMRVQIEAITGRRADSRVVDEVSARSGGNPFFAEELIAAGDPHDRLPPSLRELLLARVGALSAGAQELLGVAAVAGPTLDHDVLAEVTGLDESGLTARLREAVGEQLLIPSADAGSSLYAFRHALLQEAVYDDLLPRDRRRLHGRYAEVLARRPTPAGAAGASHLSAIAHHAESAHELPRALGAMLEAARAAFAAHAAAEASHAYAHCLELWDVVSPDDRPAGIDLVDVLYEASFAHTGAGDPRKAEEVAGRAVDLAGDADPDLAAGLIERLGRTQWLKGDLVAASESLERAMALVGDGASTAVSARVRASMAGVLMLRGKTKRAIEIARSALALSADGDNPGTTTFALNTLSAALADRGQCREAREVGERGLAMAHAHGTLEDIHRAYANLGTALQVCGDLDDAVSVAVEGGRWARARGMWRLQGAFLQGNAANVRFEQGRWREALELLDFEEAAEAENVARLNIAVTAGPLAVRMGQLARAHALLDDKPQALTRALDSQFTGPLYRGLVELAIEEGRPDDVEGLVDAAIAVLGDTDDIRHQAALLALAVEAAAAASTRSAGRPESGAGRGPTAVHVMAARLDHLRALIEKDDGEPRRDLNLARASLATAEAEAASAIGGKDAATAWASASAQWSDLGQPFEAAGAALRHAEALVTGGHRSAAEAVLQGALQAATEMGAEPLASRIERLAALARLRLAATQADAESAADSQPGTAAAAGRAAPAVGPATRPFGLTEREAQILPLLAAGSTNRQIAEALFMSESTAGVHVSRIIGKMGVANRVEAAALAVRSGLAD